MTNTPGKTKTFGKTMTSLVPAALAAFLAAGATYAVAQSAAPAPGAAPRGPEARMEQRDERRAERMERFAQRMEQRFNERLAWVKQELKLTPTQQPLFASVEQQIRKMADERRASRRDTIEKLRTAELPDRLDIMADRAAKGATNLKDLSNAVKPLWASLSEEQKTFVRKNIPRGGMMGMMGGGRGERGEGPGRGHWWNRDRG